jgi:hypothetical protein
LINETAEGEINDKGVEQMKELKNNVEKIHSHFSKL